MLARVIAHPQHHETNWTVPYGFMSWNTAVTVPG